MWLWIYFFQKNNIKPIELEQMCWFLVRSHSLVIRVTKLLKFDPHLFHSVISYSLSRVGNWEVCLTFWSADFLYYFAGLIFYSLHSFNKYAYQQKKNNKKGGRCGIHFTVCLIKIICWFMNTHFWLLFMVMIRRMKKSVLKLTKFLVQVCGW
jgi:hypothetical protein